MLRKVWALCPGTFGVGLLESFPGIALTVCSLCFRDPSIMPGLTVNKSHQTGASGKGLGDRSIPLQQLLVVAPPPPHAVLTAPVRYLPDTWVPCSRSGRGTGRSGRYSRSCWGHTGRPGCSRGRTWSAGSLVRGQRVLRGLQAQLSRNALTFPAVQQAELAVEAQGKRRQRAFSFPSPPPAACS